MAENTQADARPGPRGIANGPNSRPLDETLAETGPGIPDDAVAEGELRPDEPAGEQIDQAAQALRKKGWTDRPG